MQFADPGMAEAMFQFAPVVAKATPITFSPLAELQKIAAIVATLHQPNTHKFHSTDKDRNAIDKCK